MVLPNQIPIWKPEATGTLNRSVDSKVLMYNRVMKCGSTSMMSHVYKMAKVKGFDVIVNNKYVFIKVSNVSYA